MSTDYFLGCRRCMEMTPVATCGLSGWLSFQTDSTSVRNFVSKHQDHRTEVSLYSEHDDEVDSFTIANDPEPYYNGKKESEL